MRYLWSLLFSFEGRIRRLPFWIVLVLSFVINVLLIYIGTELDIAFHTERITSFALFQGLFPFQAFLPILSLYCLFAVLVKRLHDRNKSARWVTLILIPFVGASWLLIECGLLPGTEGPNDWDEEPAAVIDPAS